MATPSDTDAIRATLVEMVQQTLASATLQGAGAPPSHTSHLFGKALGALQQPESDRQQQQQQQQQQSSSSAVEWADAAVDHLSDVLHRTSFKDVSVQTRTLFMLASICKAAAHLPPPRLQVIRPVAADPDHLRSALHALDRGLLVSGAPVCRQRILACIAEIQSHLSAHAGRADTATAGLPEPCASAADDRSTWPHIDPLRSVPVHHQPLSISAFSRHLRYAKTPIVIQGVMDDWPCFSSASPWRDVHGYLLHAMGPDRLVPVEVGSRYTDDAWSQRLVTVREFVEHLGGVPAADGEDGEDGGEGRPPPMYLAQHNLLDQMPRLCRDILVPDYCYVKYDHEGDERERRGRGEGKGEGGPVLDDAIVNAWLGPGGTVSPLHTDPHDNLFAQVHGHKYVRLYAPDQTRALYPHDSGTMLSNTSRVDAVSPDLTPEYVECVVGPGDLLLIPRGWWHYVRSLSMSISLSFWF
ncbi:hypothetical protein BC831DRAFT_479363 [Entophlyctis helioformis]|nr:hypothetical protein BC831DRAFT_479363 [Entophlyctis helioformis]